jgi:hypothetical protein
MNEAIMANKGYKDLALCPRGVEPEEDGQDDQDAIGADRYTVPSESVLMRSDPKPGVEKLQEEFASVVHDIGALEDIGVNFFEAEPDSELNAAESEVPEFIDVDVAVDSGAGDNVLAGVDVPGHKILDSPGSLRGQQFKGAGGHVMANEGQIVLKMLAPLEEGNTTLLT